MSGEIFLTVPGRLTADPELRFTPSGSAVANFTVAHNAREFDKQTNEWKDKPTNFFPCSAWRDAAENVAELTKGTAVIVYGELKTRSWETKEGEKRSRQEIEVMHVGPDLRWKSRNGSGGSSQQGGAGQGWGGQQGGGGGGNWNQSAAAQAVTQQAQAGQQGGGGGWGGQPAAQSDPWAAGSTATGSGWGSGPDSEPPF